MPPNPGFDLATAKDLVSIVATLQGATPPLPLPALPVANWGNAPIFDSPQIGAFDNKWQLWQAPNHNRYAVVIRGTVDTTGSIFEDLMAVMIPARGTLPVGSVNFAYQLAADDQAAVHLGFFLGMGVLLFDAAQGILTQLKNLPPGSEVCVVGHSQGAAIATLCRSFLQYTNILAGKNFTYPTFVYAQPKPGNDHYGRDFERITSNTGTGFTITNTQDWVPQVPLTFQLPGGLNQPNPLDVVTGQVIFALFSKGIDTLREHLIDVHLARHVPQLKAFETILQNQNHQAVTASANSDLTPLIKPSLNFVNCGSPITLAGTPGANPSDPKDAFWQHHASMYFKLLDTAFP